MGGKLVTGGDYSGMNRAFAESGRKVKGQRNASNDQRQTHQKLVKGEMKLNSKVDRKLSDYLL
jgi:hypothetical protein